MSTAYHTERLSVTRINIRDLKSQKKGGGDPKSDKKEKDGQIFLGTECSGEVQNIPFLFL